jgi:hypothetical protein
MLEVCCQQQNLQKLVDRKLALALSNAGQRTFVYFRFFLFAQTEEIRIIRYWAIWLNFCTSWRDEFDG